MTKPRFLLISVVFFLLSGCVGPESTPTTRVAISEESIYDADISQDGKLGIISVSGGAVEVWKLDQPSRIFTWRHQGDGVNLVDIVRLSPDASVAVTADTEAFALWNMQSGEPIGFWRIESGTTIRDIAVSNNGQAILVGRANGQVMYFEPYTDRRLEFIAHQEKINSVDISANGRYAISGSNDYMAYLWDTQTGQIVHVFTHPHRVSKVMLDQQARYIFTADSQDHATVWNAQSGEKLTELKFVERQLIFTAARFSSDGSSLLTGSPARRLALWDLKNGKSTKQWLVRAHPKSPIRSAVVYAVGFSDESPISISSSGFLSHWE